MTKGRGITAPALVDYDTEVLTLRSDNRPSPARRHAAPPRRPSHRDGRLLREDVCLQLLP